MQAFKFVVGVAHHMRLGSALIVLTATIDPGRLDNLVIADPILRWTQYQEAVTFWLEHPSVGSVALFENSGFPVDFSTLEDTAERRGKPLEVVSYNGNVGTSEKGRGYGEGEILNRAVSESQLIRQHESFFKVTGRFKVTNFTRLESSSRKHPVVVNERSLRRRRWVDTRFFKMTADFYQTHLSMVHHEAQSIDYVLGEGYARALHPLGVPAFRFPVRVVGVAGNGSQYNDSTLKFAVKSMFAMAGGYRV